MELSYHSVFEKFDKQLSAVESRMHGQLSSRNRATLQSGVRTPAVENSFLNARLARLQEEVNRLTAMVHEKELALECNALQLQRNTDELMRWERENAALRTTLSDEKNLVAVTLRENERLDNEMRFLKAELDYRRGEVDEISGREEETAALLKKKDDENAQLFVRLKVLEDEREELNAKLQLSGLRHRTLYAGDVPLRRHRRGVISRLFAWLSKPILVIGHIPE